MPTKRVIDSHTRLKLLYEQEFGKTISDCTWRRRVSEMKQFIVGFNVLNRDASKQVANYAVINKMRGRLINSKHHHERMLAFKYFRDIGKKTINLSGDKFLTLLAGYLKVDLKQVPISTRYYWFSRINLKFNPDSLYPIDELCFVAYVAAIWTINKRQTDKSADPNASKLAK